MGCIEIVMIMFEGVKTKEINRNMGCIEIVFITVTANTVSMINRNMGCIEIVQPLWQSREYND